MFIVIFQSEQVINLSILNDFFNLAFQTSHLLICLYKTLFILSYPSYLILPHSYVWYSEHLFLKVLNQWSQLFITSNCLLRYMQELFINYGPLNIQVLYNGVNLHDRVVRVLSLLHAHLTVDLLSLVILALRVLAKVKDRLARLAGALGCLFLPLSQLV